MKLILFVFVILSIVIVSIESTQHDHFHATYEEEEACEDADMNMLRKLLKKFGMVGLTQENYDFLLAKAGMGVDWQDCVVIPTFDGFDEDKFGVLTASFGYNNKCPGTVRIPIGDFNRFHPEPVDRGQPIEYRKGIHRSVFKIPMVPQATLHWDIISPNREKNHVIVAGKFFSESMETKIPY